MCKYHEIPETNEIKCDYCGKKYKKKNHPKSQMMAHSQYCDNKNYTRYYKLTIQSIVSDLLNIKQTDDEIKIYNEWKNGIIKNNVKLTIYKTDYKNAPHEDSWNSMEELNVDETKYFLENGYIEDTMYCEFEENDTRFISIDLENLDDSAIYLPISLIDEFKDIEIKVMRNLS